MAQYKNLLIQIMAHISENEMTQLKDMFQIVATWLQFSTEEYTKSSHSQNLDGIKSRKTLRKLFPCLWTLV